MKCGFLTVSYSGQFYDGPALPVVEQIRKARALGFEGIAIETKRPVASPLGTGVGYGGCAWLFAWLFDEPPAFE